MFVVRVAQGRDLVFEVADGLLVLDVVVGGRTFASISDSDGYLRFPPTVTSSIILRITSTVFLRNMGLWMTGRKGAVTVATNMAGRGTDIVLGGKAEALWRSEIHQKLSLIHI